MALAPLDVIPICDILSSFNGGLVLRYSLKAFTPLFNISLFEMSSFLNVVFICMAFAIAHAP